RPVVRVGGRLELVGQRLDLGTPRRRGRRRQEAEPQAALRHAVQVFPVGEALPLGRVAGHGGWLVVGCWLLVVSGWLSATGWTHEVQQPTTNHQPPTTSGNRRPEP